MLLTHRFVFVWRPLAKPLAALLEYRGMGKQLVSLHSYGLLRHFLLEESAVTSANHVITTLSLSVSTGL